MKKTLKTIWKDIVDAWEEEIKKRVLYDFDLLKFWLFLTFWLLLIMLLFLGERWPVFAGAMVKVFLAFVILLILKNVYLLIRQITAEGEDKTLRMIKKYSQKHITWFFIMVLITVVTMVLNLPEEDRSYSSEQPDIVPVDVNLAVEEDQEPIKKSGDYTPVTRLNDRKLKWFTARIEEHKYYADIYMQYPQFIGGDEVEQLNEQIKGDVLMVFNFYDDHINELIASKGISYDEDLCEETLWSCGVQLVSTYRVTSIINNIVSLELVLADFDEGGNGYYYSDYIHAINWDLKNDKLLDKEDIFCYMVLASNHSFSMQIMDLNKLSPIVYRNMFSKYGASINGERWPSIKNNIDEKIKSSEFEVLLGYRGLSIVFQPYTIFSDSEDVIRIPISYSDLEGMLCF